MRESRSAFDIPEVWSLFTEGLRRPAPFGVVAFVESLLQALDGCVKLCKLPFGDWFVTERGVSMKLRRTVGLNGVVGRMPERVSQLDRLFPLSWWRSPFRKEDFESIGTRQFW